MALSFGLVFRALPVGLQTPPFLNSSSPLGPRLIVPAAWEAILRLALCFVLVDIGHDTMQTPRPLMDQKGVLEVAGGVEVRVGYLLVGDGPVHPLLSGLALLKRHKQTQTKPLSFVSFQQYLASIKVWNSGWLPLVGWLS
jgi:hypothetical protein